MNKWIRYGGIMLSFFVFMLPKGSGQQVLVSDEFQLRSDLQYFLIGEFKGQVLIFRDLTNTFEVQAFDQNMRSSWKKEIALERRSPEILGIQAIDDEFAVFYKHRSRGTTKLRANRYDASANIKDTIIMADLGNIFFNPTVTLVRSADRTKVLLYFIDKQRVIQVFVFDLNQMQTIWAKRFEPDDYRWAEDIIHMNVDNNGRMHMVIEKDSYRARRNSSHLDVYQFPMDGGLMTFHEVNLPAIEEEHVSVYDLFFRYDNLNNRLSAGGLYYTRNAIKSEGYLFFALADGALRNTLSYHPFTESFVESILGKEIRKNKGLEEIKIQDVVLRQDGGLVIIGEEARNYQRRLASNSRLVYDGAARSITDFYYNDLFALCVHPDGSLDWETVMHKKQYSQDDFGAYSSFFLFKNPGSLRLIFNDEIKYENTVSQYALFSSGRLDRMSLLSTANLNLRLRFRDALQVSPTKILVPSERRNRVRIAKIELD